MILTVLNVKMGKNIHVVTHNGEWAVRKEGNKNVSSIFSTQKDAINFGKTIAKESQSELFIHGRNGQIRERNTYGIDLFPPRG